MAHHTSVLIIGAGQAASVLARELRSLGFSGSITLVGDETHLPYERPPLSKDVLKSSATTDSVFLQKAEFYQEQNIELLLGTSVQSLDCATRQASHTQAVDPDFREPGSRIGAQADHPGAVAVKQGGVRRVQRPGQHDRYASGLPATSIQANLALRDTASP